MPVTPSMTDVITQVIESRLSEVFTALPGKVIAYNPSDQVADVQPEFVLAIDDDGQEKVSEELPVCQRVPIMYPGSTSGGYSISFPLRPGDHGLIVCAMRNIGAWQAAGAKVDPGDRGIMTLSGAVFIPGLRAVKNAGPNPGTSLVMDAPQIKIGGTSASQAAVLGTALLEWLNTHTHGVSGAATTVPTKQADPLTLLSTKVKIG